MFDSDANNTFIVYIYMRVCLECRIDTKKEWWDNTNRVTSAPAPTTIDILDLIVHGSSNDDAEGDQQSKGGDGGKDST
jgi:hypothetical protein